MLTQFGLTLSKAEVTVDMSGYLDLSSALGRWVRIPVPPSKRVTEDNSFYYEAKNETE